MVEQQHRAKRYPGDKDIQQENKTPARPTYYHWGVPLISFLYITAYNTSINTFGQYIENKIHSETFPNETINSTAVSCEVDTNSTKYLKELDVQQEISEWEIYFYLSGGIAAIVSNFLLGVITDRVGRKFLFLLSCAGTILRTTGAIIGMHFDIALYYYVIGYFIEGCTGQFYTIVQATLAYIADITEVGKQRTTGIVIGEVFLELGVVIPTLMTGFILTYLNSFLIPMITSGGLLIVAFLLYLTIPETHHKQKRERKQQASQLDSLKDSLELYFSKKNGRKRWLYILIITVFALTSFVVLGKVDSEILMWKIYPFCWDREKIGVFRATRLVGTVLVLGIVKILHLCMNDEMIAVLASLFYVLANALEAFARTDTMMYTVGAIGIFGFLTLPITRAILSMMTPAHKQGSAFATIAAVESAVSLVGAVSSSVLYITTVKINRGYVFLFYAGVHGISAILMMIFLLGAKDSEKYPQSSYEIFT